MSCSCRAWSTWASRAKLASDEERHRLKRILQAHRVGTTGGFIVRTAGEGVPEEEIAADMNFLYNLWLDIRQKAEKKPAPALLHYDLDLVQRILARSGHAMSSKRSGSITKRCMKTF